MFIDTSRIAVFIDSDPENIIFIKPKMDFGTKNRVQDAMMQISANDASGAKLGMVIGAYTVALAVHNIVDWDGPKFRLPSGQKMACTPQNIQRLDPDEPLVERAMEEIARRNPLGRTKKSSNASTSAGGPSSTANGATPAAASTSTSG